LKAVRKQGRASGKNIKNGFNFSAHARPKGDAFFLHQITDKKDTELAVDDQQKRPAGKMPSTTKQKKQVSCMKVSAKGSKSLPKSLTSFCLRATMPSSISDNSETMKMNQSTGTVHASLPGNKKTIKKTGARMILENVILFAKLIDNIVF
jgi:hypothetical protein